MPQEINDKKIILLTGPSDKLKRDLLLALKQQMDFNQIIPLTTRPPKATEINGEDFNFISEPEFNKLIESDQIFSAYSKKGNSFGVTFEELSNKTKQGNWTFWFTNLEEALEIKNKFPNIIIFFIIANFDILLEYMNEGGAIPEKYLNQKITEVKKELEKAANQVNFTITLESKDFTKTATQIKELLENKK